MTTARPRTNIAAHGNYKSTKEEMEARLFQVYKMLCRGDSRATIFQFCRKEWGVSVGSVDKYLKRARALMADDFRQDREEFAVEILAGLRDLRRRAIADKQYGVALGCISRMAAITGVDGSNRVDR